MHHLHDFSELFPAPLILVVKMSANEGLLVIYLQVYLKAESIMGKHWIQNQNTWNET